LPLTRRFTKTVQRHAAALWQLHMAAADAHQTGHPAAAHAIVEIADAAEEAWLRAEGAREFAV